MLNPPLETIAAKKRSQLRVFAGIYAQTSEPTAVLLIIIIVAYLDRKTPDRTQKHE